MRSRCYVPSPTPTQSRFDKSNTREAIAQLGSCRLGRWTIDRFDEEQCDRRVLHLEVPIRQTRVFCDLVIAARVGPERRRRSGILRAHDRDRDDHNSDTDEQADAGATSQHHITARDRLAPPIRDDAIPAAGTRSSRRRGSTELRRAARPRATLRSPSLFPGLASRSPHPQAGVHDVRMTRLGPLRAAVAELTSRVAELALHLATQEHNCRDHGKRDESNEEDVLDHARTTLNPGELGLKPRLAYEQSHARPFVLAGPSCLAPPLNSSAERRVWLIQVLDHTPRVRPNPSKGGIAVRQGSLFVSRGCVWARCLPGPVFSGSCRRGVGSRRRR